MISAVAELLRHAGENERGPLVYLLQAQLRPPYEGVELGLGEKLLTEALAMAYDESSAQVARRYTQLGDLGLVAEAIGRSRRGRTPTVLEVYNALLDVAQAVGGGSVQRKISLVASLLQRMDGGEAKFVVRIMQGRLRLGVGDQTIINATAVAALGDGRKKAAVEHAYNVRSDLGGIVRLAFAHGERGLRSIEPEIGVPIRPALAQRLSSAGAIIERLGTVQAEPKYDGFRLQLHRDGERVWAFSRRLENVTAMFPELAAALVRELTVTRAIIEGEAVVYNPETGAFLPFQVTITRKRKTNVAEAAAHNPLRLFAFDLLYAGHESYLQRPQRERSERLRQLVHGSPRDPIVVTEAHIIASPSKLEAYFNEMISRGLEGVLAKRPDAAYQAGARGYDWVKLKRAYQSKLRDTIDLVLVGYLRGRGKRAALGIGSLLGAVYDSKTDRFRTVAKIGSGPSDREWQDLRRQLDKRARRNRPEEVDSLILPDVWVEPTIVVEVLADEITRSPSHTCGRVAGEPGYALRFPRLLGIRSDKAPTDATTEREIVDLYRLQRTAKPARKRAPANGKKGRRTKPAPSAVSTT